MKKRTMSLDWTLDESCRDTINEMLEKCVELYSQEVDKEDFKTLRFTQQQLRAAKVAIEQLGFAFDMVVDGYSIQDDVDGAAKEIAAMIDHLEIIWG